MLIAAHSGAGMSGGVAQRFVAWSVLLLCGCAAGPSFTKAEAPLPASWHAAEPTVATPATVDGSWWKAFKDPALDKLVELAAAQNLPLQVAGLRIAEARAQLEISRGQQFPQLQVALGTFTANGITEQVAQATRLDRNFVDYEIGFDALWELDLWGKYRRGVEASASSVRATEADYDAALVSLTAEVARTYVTIRTSESLLELAKKNVAVQEQSLGVAQSRYRNGAASELDATQASALLETTRATIPQIQRDIQQGRNALATLLGQPAGTIDQLLVGPPVVPEAPPTVAVGVPADMVRRRPDVRSAEALAAAQSARIGVAKSQLYPRLILVGTVGLQAANTGPTSHNLFSRDAFNYTVGPRIAWPFLNYGRLTNDVRVQDARFEEAVVDYQNTVLKALQEVEDALAGLARAREAMVFQEKSLVSTRRAVELSLIEYREGAVDYQRVLDSQRSLLQQENTVASTTSSVATSLIALYKALGGGWEVREGRPFVSEPVQREMNDRTGFGDLFAPRTPENPPVPPQGGR